MPKKKKQAKKPAKKSKKESAKPWSGRFKEGTAESVENFTSSISFEQRLLKYDLLANVAHAKALLQSHVISSKEYKRIIKGLTEIAKQAERGKIKLKKELEDIHMNIEKLLIDKIGDTGKKIHTGRSRNDQVATDLRMYLKDEAIVISGLIKDLQGTLVNIAENNISVIMPGYTHMQRAQPVLFSHHLMAYFEMFLRDRERLADCFSRIDVLPLGSAALAGTSLKMDRSMLAKDLGFSKISRNSIDAVSDRDFVIEFLHALSTIMMHLSRFSEELVLWSSYDFGFVELGDAFTTGSSIMPQKKNPDVAELIRGKTGRVYGHLISLLTLLKAQSLAYNRDLQEDKEAVFDAIDTVKSSLLVFTQMLRTMIVNKEKISSEVNKGFLTATELAGYLVRKGVPFRQAHNIVGKIVNYCIESNMQLHYLSPKEFKKFSDKFGMDVMKVVDAEHSVRAKDVIGGTAPARVKEAIKRAKEALKKES